MKKLVVFSVLLIVAGLVGLGISNDWSKGFEGLLQMEKVSKEQIIERVQANKYVLNLDGLDAEVRQGTGENLVVRLEGSASKRYLDKLSFDVQQDKDMVSINAGVDALFFSGYNFYNLRTVVELPANAIARVEIVNKSGNVRIDKVEADKLEVRMGSGNFSGSKVKASELNLSLTSGNMKSEEFNITQSDIKLGSGDLRMNHFAGSKLDVSTRSGNINLDNSLGEIVAKTGSGNIKISVLNISSNMVLNTRSGNISLTTKGEPSPLQFKLHTRSGVKRIKWSDAVYNGSMESGELNGHVGGGSDRLIDASTGSGDIWLGSR